MKSRLLKVLLVALLALAIPAVGHAVTFGFDELGISGGNPVPNGYQGFNWNNFYYISPVQAGLCPSGYCNGLVSPPNVAYNAFANPASFMMASAFTFNSAYLTGAWNDGLNITIQGFLGAVLVNTTTVIVNSTAPSLITLNWSGINRVNFISFGGVPHPGYNGAGTHFAIDNITVNGGAVPEPASLTLLGTGLICLIGFARRRFS